MLRTVLAALVACALPAAILPASAQPVGAEPPLSAEAFEAHVTGRTITYDQHGQIFGVEEYLTDRRVRWSVQPDLCQYGIWYPQDDDICFVYEDDPIPSCWTFWLRDGALVALSTLDSPGQELYEVDNSQTPLPCPGPDVGV